MMAAYSYSEALQYSAMASFPQLKLLIQLAFQYPSPFHSTNFILKLCYNTRTMKSIMSSSIVMMIVALGAVSASEDARYDASTYNSY